jgi:hypothetical protein
VAYASKPHLAALRANAILDFEVPSLHADLDAVAEKRQDSGSIDGGFAERVFLR